MTHRGSSQSIEAARAKPSVGAYFLTAVRTSAASASGQKVLALSGAAISSLASFCVVALLARTLPMQSFGLFVLATALVQFAKSLHWSFVTSPIQVIHAGGDAQTFADVLSAVTLVHWACTSILSLAVVISALYLRSQDGVGLPFYFAILILSTAQLTQELTRRTLQAQLRFARALCSEVVSSGAQIGASLLLLTVGWTDVSTAMIVIAASTWAGILVAGLQRPCRVSKEQFNYILRRHSAYARWLAPTMVVLWLQEKYHLFAASALLTPAAAALIGSAVTLFGAANILFTGIDNYGMPTGARLRAKGDWASLRDLFRSMYLWNAVGVIAYVTPVVVFASPILKFAFGATYGNRGTLVALAGLRFYISAFGRPPVMMLQVLQQPAQLFVAYLIAAVMACASVAPLIKTFGEGGALLSVAFGELCLAAYATWACNRALIAAPRS